MASYIWAPGQRKKERDDCICPLETDFLRRGEQVMMKYSACYLIAWEGFRNLRIV